MFFMCFIAWHFDKNNNYLNRNISHFKQNNNHLKYEEGQFLLNSSSSSIELFGKLSLKYKVKVIGCIITLYLVSVQHSV